MSGRRGWIDDVQVRNRRCQLDCSIILVCTLEFAAATRETRRDGGIRIEQVWPLAHRIEKALIGLRQAKDKVSVGAARVGVGHTKSLGDEQDISG